MRSVSRSPSMSSWMFAGRPLHRHMRAVERRRVSCDVGHLAAPKDGGPGPSLTPAGAGALTGHDLPSAGGAARGRVRGGPAAQPVAVQVGGRVVDGQALLVALAHLGEDVSPGSGLHAVVGLDVQRPLGLDDLEHLRAGGLRGAHGRAPGLHREGCHWPCQPAQAAWGHGEAARLGWLSPARLGWALPFLGPRCTASLPPGWLKWMWPLHKSASFPGPPSSLSETDFVQDMPQQTCPASYLHPQTGFRTSARAVVHPRGAPLSLPCQGPLLCPPGRCYVPPEASQSLCCRSCLLFTQQTLLRSRHCPKFWGLSCPNGVSALVSV